MEVDFVTVTAGEFAGPFDACAFELPVEIFLTATARRGCTGTDFQ